MRSVVSLESQSVQTQQQKYVVRTRDSKRLAFVVLKSLSKQLNIEKNTHEAPAALRSKRQVQKARRLELVSLYELKIEQFSMGMEDVSQQLVQFHERRLCRQTAFTEFLRPIEETLAPQKVKFRERLTGFTRSIVDSIHEELNVDKESELLNSIVFKIQCWGRDFVSKGKMPSVKDINDCSKFSHEAVVLLNLLQFLRLFVSHNISTLETIEALETYCELFATCMPIIAYTCRAARNWKQFGAIAVHIVNNLFPVIYGALHMSQLLLDRLHIVKSSNPSNRVCLFTHLNQMLQWGGDFSSEVLAIDVLVWLKLTLSLLSDYRGRASSECVKCAVMEALDCTYTSEEVTRDWVMSVDSGCAGAVYDSLRNTLCLGNPTVANLLYAAELVCQLLLSPSMMAPPPLVKLRSSLSQMSVESISSATATSGTSLCERFGTLSHEILLEALHLGHHIVKAHTARFGSVGDMRIFGHNDLLYLNAANSEMTAAMRCATTCFSYGLYEEEALALLMLGNEICIPRGGSFMLMTSWLNCVQCALLSCIEVDAYDATAGDLCAKERWEAHTKGIAGGHRYRPLQFKVVAKDAVCKGATSCGVRVLGVAALHKHSLSMSHKAMLITRLLIRDLFMRRSQVDELCSVKLVASVRSVQHIKKEDEDDEDLPSPPAPAQHTESGAVSESESRPQSPDGHIASSRPGSPEPAGAFSFPPSPTTTSPLMSPNGSKPATPMIPAAGKGGGGKVDKGVAELVEKFKSQIIYETYYEHSGADCTLAELLTYIGENHVQSAEVVEHAAGGAPGIAVADDQVPATAGIQLVVQRIMDSQSSGNVYLLALCEICLELLEM